MAKTILQEIAARVAKKHNITIKSAESFVSQFFDVVKEGLDEYGLPKEMYGITLTRGGNWSIVKQKPANIRSRPAVTCGE